MRDGAERHLWPLALLLGQRDSTSWELADGTPIDAHAHLLALVGLMPAREREQLVERCWTLAGAVSSLLCALGWAEIREDVLTRAVVRWMIAAGNPGAPGAHGYVDGRADLYQLDARSLRCIAEDLDREHDELLDEISARAGVGPDLEEAIIAAAAAQEASTRRRNAIYHSRIWSRCLICGAPCGAPCRSLWGNETIRMWSPSGGYIHHVNGRASNA